MAFYAKKLKHCQIKEGLWQAQAQLLFSTLLAPHVQKALATLGFTEPTLPQTKAFPAVLAGENVLLVAPTGSGKTEAVLLPVLSKLVEQKEKPVGISVIYITPLRALNRDMLKRLTFWAQQLGH